MCRNLNRMYHPARASSDVASSLAPSPGRRPAPEGAWSARRGVLRLQSARCSIRPVVPGKVLRPRRKRRRCPSPTALGGPQSSRRKSAGGGGCGDDRASLCQRCRPSDGVGSGRRVYPSRPVVRPDSSTSSIRRSCRNTPSGGLVGAAPLGVASVYGHSPFGADSAPGGEPPLPLRRT